MRDLTERQEQILNYIEKNQRGPTLREIGKNCGLASPSSVLDHINVLVSKGYLGRNDSGSIYFVQGIK